MRWFLDTEFNDDGRAIELISLALVSEAGDERLWVSNEFSEVRCNPWVQENVLTRLPLFKERVARAQIAADVRELLLRDGKPEIWAYFADYDWVALCQLYGPMVALPKGFPFWCRDLKQLMTHLGIQKDELPRQENKHDALADARWVRDAFLYIESQGEQSRRVSSTLAVLRTAFELIVSDTVSEDEAGAVLAVAVDRAIGELTKAQGT
jgi:3' exoribonuclease, RNase T-like